MHPAIAPLGHNSVFYWNLDATVGLNGVNNWDDVLFVQWCLYQIGTKPWDNLGAKASDFGVVTVDGNSTGRPDDQLVQAIRHLQAIAQLDMDGKIDPISSAIKYTSSHGPRTHLIMTLNKALSQMYPDQYPRLDKMPKFIWRVREISTYPFLL